MVRRPFNKPFNTPLISYYWAYNEDNIKTLYANIPDTLSDKSPRSIKQKPKKVHTRPEYAELGIYERDYHSYLVGVFSRELDMIENKKKEATDEEYFRLCDHFQRYKELNKKPRKQ